MYIFLYCVDSRIVNSNGNGLSSFSGNLFVILVYYFEVTWNALLDNFRHAVLVNSTSDMTAVFFILNLQIYAGLV